MARFEHREGGAVISFEDDEASLLRQLIGEMRDLLEQPPPQDPAIARLFPAAYEDPAEAAAFSELVGSELDRSKKTDLEKVGRAFEAADEHEVLIARDEVEAWVRALTDMRLALGTRLDVTEEKMADELDPADPCAASMAVLHWLGWLQESLIDVLTGEEQK